MSTTANHAVTSARVQSEVPAEVNAHVNLSSTSLSGIALDGEQVRLFLHMEPVQIAQHRIDVVVILDLSVSRLELCGSAVSEKADGLSGDNKPRGHCGNLVKMSQMH